MKAEEFLKRITPAARRSKLAPHFEDINKLRAAGCTLDQVCEFLRENGVTMTVAGLSAYLRRQGGPDRQTNTSSRPAAQASAVAATAGAPRDGDGEKGDGQAEQDDELARKSLAEQQRIRRERKSKAVIDDGTSNHVLQIVQGKDK